MNIDWRKILAVVLGLVVLAGVAVSMIWLRRGTKPAILGNLGIQNQSSTTNTPVDVSGILNYRNDEYGFEINLPSGYKGYTTRESKNTSSSQNDGVIGRVLFSVDASNVEWTSGKFDVFEVVIYDPIWWKENADFKEKDSYAWLKGAEEDLGSYLGNYVGENSKYIFVLLGGSQDCPTSKTDPSNYGSNTIQCSLSAGVKDLNKDFKFIEPATSTVDTSGWKIYKNDRFGFEIKYPKEWGINSWSKGIDLKIGTIGHSGDIWNGSALISIFSEPLNSSLDKYIQNDMADSLSYSTSSVLIGGLNFVESSSYSLLDRYVSKRAFVEHGGNVYVFSLTYNEGDQEGIKFSDVFGGVLSTFKFIGS